MVRSFGTVEKLPSGRYRAKYVAPDGKRYSAPRTFITKKDARGWLALQESAVIRNAWVPPEVKATMSITFGDYAEGWLAQRTLKTRTREGYRAILDHHLLPAFGTRALVALTADEIRQWYAGALVSTPTLRSHAYGLLRTILGTALADGKITANPCAIRGAGTTKRVKQIRPATLDELGKIVGEMPPRYQALILLASWNAMRFGELIELRRKDIILDPDKGRGVIRIERGAVRTDEGHEVTTPKSDAGRRDVAVPPHLVGVLAEHLATHVGAKADALMFPAEHGGHLAPSTLYRHFYRAREKAGRPDLRFHDLRHTGQVLAAMTPGTSLADLMNRLGHSSPQAAMRYMHVAEGRDSQIAEALSRIARGE